MTSWTDKAGHMLAVMPADDLSPARLVIGLASAEPFDCAAFWLDGKTDLAEIAVAMFTANGQPPPVITPRPDIGLSTAEPFGPCLRLSVAGRRVRLGTDAGVTLDELEPYAARTLAGLLVALADAAAQEPYPADVERLAALVTEASRMAPEDAARYLLRKGVTLPAEGDGNG